MPSESSQGRFKSFKGHKDWRPTLERTRIAFSPLSPLSPFKGHKGLEVNFDIFLMSSWFNRLLDLDYNTSRPSLSWSTTGTTALGVLNRFRSWFYHSSSTGSDSSNSLENSSEFRWWSALQEFLDRYQDWPMRGVDLARYGCRRDETRRPGLGTPAWLYGI
jgi:hypothetical protein